LTPPFKLSAKAKSDLKSIARYTHENWGREQRNVYLKQMDETFRTLARQSSLGIACDYIKPGYRKFPQGSHIVYYREGTTTKIEIIRILHKNMDVELNLGAP
jgi:toxin ParE1/3/4